MKSSRAIIARELDLYLLKILCCGHEHADVVVARDIAVQALADALTNVIHRNLSSQIKESIILETETI